MSENVLETFFRLLPKEARDVVLAEFLKREKRINPNVAALLGFPREDEAAQAEASRAAGLPGYMLCHVHAEELVGYCETCATVVCARCLAGCAAHAVRTLNELAREQVPALEEDMLAAFVKAAAARLEEVQAQILELYSKVLELERTVRASEEYIDVSREHLAADLRELQAARNTLDALEKRMHFDATRASARDAAAALCVSEGATREHFKTEADRNRRLIETAHHRNEIERLRGEAERLKFVVQREGAPATLLGRAVLVLQGRAFAGAFGQSACVGLFRAFPGCGQVPAVADALRAALTDFHGIQLSEPVQVPQIPAGERAGCTATLSVGGILCASAANVLHVHDLRAWRSGVLSGCGASAFACERNGTLFVSWSGTRAVYATPLETALRGGAVCTADALALPAPMSTAPFLDRASDEGWLAFVHGNTTYRVDLAARTCEGVAGIAGTGTLAGLCGITAPGFRYAAWNQNNKTLSYRAADGAQVTVATAVTSFPTILPSSANPTDLSCAAVLQADGNLLYKGAQRQLRVPVHVAANRALVRIHSDVFLCLSRLDNAWYALRVAVP